MSIARQSYLSQISALFLLTLLFSLALPTSNAINLLHPFSILLQAGEQQCFFESLEPSNVRKLAYEVWEGENFLVNVRIMGPSEDGIRIDDLQIFYDRDASDGDFTITARMPGEHSFCFQNRWSDPSRVSFDLVEPETVAAPAKATVLTPLLSSIENIAIGVLNMVVRIDHFNLIQKRSIYIASHLSSSVNRLSLAKLFSVLLSSVVTVVVPSILHFTIRDSLGKSGQFQPILMKAAGLAVESSCSWYLAPLWPSLIIFETLK
ncbi:Transmembrane emp24 domain-containing protein 2 [Gonapodya sp. JEL0774]|nr:Transmembrane emp24 domain-containing protein 2 [Gonapodya sp. JEL0774]